MKTLEDKVNDACHRIEDLYHETDGKCYVSFSGGKDSTVLLALIKLCEEVYTIPPGAIPAVFSNTGIELGVTVDFVRLVRDSGWYQNVQVVRPEKSFDWTIKKYGKPLKSKLRSEALHRWKCANRTQYLFDSLITGEVNGKVTIRTKLADKDMHMVSDDFPIIASPKCCDILKKKPFRKYEKDNGIKGAMTGVRMAEGGAREMRAVERNREGKMCTYTNHGVLYKLPIVDWNDEDVEKFIKEYKVPLSDAYTKYGMDRTGCMACPFSKFADRSLYYLYYHEPNRYKAAMHWLKDVYIAQNVVLPFDETYERERERTWKELYEPMRQDMLRKYRPHSRLIKDEEQMTIFDYLDREKGDE